MINGIIKGILIVIGCALLFVYVVKEQRAQHKNLDAKQEKFDKQWGQFEKEFDNFLKEDKK